MKFILLLLGLGVASGFCPAKVKPNARQLRTIHIILSAVFRKDKELLPIAMRLSMKFQFHFKKILCIWIFKMFHFTGFHDCIGGSCDGCLDLDQEENKGLEHLVEIYDKILADPRISPFLSRADLWALGGAYAMIKGVRLNNIMCSKKGCPIMPLPKVPMKWGRQDCAQDANTKVSKPNGFPNVNMNRDEMMDWFKKDFQLDENQVTALIGGAHSLGRARIENTGYDGPFTKGRERYLNNQIFRVLASNNVIFKNEVQLKIALLSFHIVSFLFFWIASVHPVHTTFHCSFLF